MGIQENDDNSGMKNSPKFLLVIGYRDIIRMVNHCG